jgi:sugar O-acyltransferase (sialic acid O-acetyltransferase NeuD family)
MTISQTNANWYIYGAGGLGIEVADIIRSSSRAANQEFNLVFIDDFSTEKMIYGLNVVRLEDISGEPAIATVASGEPQVRLSLRNRLVNTRLKLASVSDSTARVSPSTMIAEGVIISPFCSISSRAKIDINSTINTMTIIGHDVTIGEDCSISSMVNLGGTVKVGARTYVGMGALIKEGVQIGDDVIIGMGSVVYSDIPSGMIALGNPARVARKNENKQVFK